jgi:hypothetical protein
VTLEPSKREHTCPSGRCTSGALLIGLIGRDGTVRYLGGPTPVDEDFVQAAGKGRNPQTRFRFAEPCVQKSCQNWSGGDCSLIGELLKDLPPSITSVSTAELPKCGIRASCVWFGKRGRSACSVCPFVRHTIA